MYHPKLNNFIEIFHKMTKVNNPNGPSKLLFLSQSHPQDASHFGPFVALTRLSTKSHYTSNVLLSCTNIAQFRHGHHFNLDKFMTHKKFYQFLYS
jgi:hypothetical protein